MTKDVLNQLFETLLARKEAQAKDSYVASLYAKGTGFIGNKVIEETVETIVEAHKEDTEKLKTESADLIFHLMVLWAHLGITPNDVLDVLQSRMGTSGHAEKASRGQN